MPNQNAKRYRLSGGHSSTLKEGSSTHTPSKPGIGGSGVAGVQYYNYQEYGHYSSNCKKEKQDYRQAVRKVGVGALKVKEAPKAIEKLRK